MNDDQIRELIEALPWPLRREEWEVTGQPQPAHGVEFPPYRFVFGGPHDGSSHYYDGTSEDRARQFIEKCTGEWLEVKLRSRVIIEQPWKDEQA